MGLTEAIIPLLQEYTPILAFLAGLVAGDVLILLAILAGAGQIPLWVIFVFGYLGEIVHDGAFYFISNSRLAHYIKRKMKLSKRRSKIAAFIEKFRGSNYFLPVFFAKFVYGVRDTVVLYVSHNEKKFKRYFITVASAGLLWMIIVLGVGWLAGRGFTELLTLLRGLEKVVIFLIISLVLIYLLNKFILSTFFKFIRKQILLTYLKRK